MSMALNHVASVFTCADFLPDPLLAKVAAPSRKYGGLPSEYHVRPRQLKPSTIFVFRVCQLQRLTISCGSCITACWPKTHAKRYRQTKSPEVR